MSWHSRMGGSLPPPCRCRRVGELEWEAGWRGWGAPCWGRKKGFPETHTHPLPHSTQQTPSRLGVLAWAFLSGFWLTIS